MPNHVDPVAGRRDVHELAPMGSLGGPAHRYQLRVNAVALQQFRYGVGAVLFVAVHYVVPSLHYLHGAPEGHYGFACTAWGVDAVYPSFVAHIAEVMVPSYLTSRGSSKPTTEQKFCSTTEATAGLILLVGGR